MTENEEVQGGLLLTNLNKKIRWISSVTYHHIGYGALKLLEIRGMANTRGTAFMCPFRATIVKRIFPRAKDCKSRNALVRRF